MESGNISFYYYNKDDFFFSDSLSVNQCIAYGDENHVKWINILGISNNDELQRIGEAFHIHPLAIEDIASPRQRAKMEEYDDMLYIVLRLFWLDEGEINDQQVSIVLRDNFLLSFREMNAGVFKKHVGEKLQNPSSALRKKGEDYLLYGLLDSIIDSYNHVLESISDQIEELDNEILSMPEDQHLMLLQKLKGNVLYIRKNILPVRDLINNLIRQDVGYFDDANKYFLRDLQDHIQRGVEEIDFQRDQLNSLMDLYYSLQAHKMNNVMKTLTGVSFVLLPLTFLASLYGMNFSFIPQANNKNGFYEMVGIMAVLALILTWFAFRRNWLSSQDFNKDKEEE